MRRYWWSETWWRDWFFLTLALVVAGLASGAWHQLQAQEGGAIFADGFESGDTCAWSRGGCEEPSPPAVNQGPCDDGEWIVRISAPYSCESYDTPHGESWRYLFGVVCSGGDVRVGIGELGLAPNACTEEE